MTRPSEPAVEEVLEDGREGIIQFARHHPGCTAGVGPEDKWRPSVRPVQHRLEPARARSRSESEASVAASHGRTPHTLPASSTTTWSTCRSTCQAGCSPANTRASSSGPSSPVTARPGTTTTSPPARPRVASTRRGASRHHSVALTSRRARDGSTNISSDARRSRRSDAATAFAAVMANNRPAAANAQPVNHRLLPTATVIAPPRITTARAPYPRSAVRTCGFTRIDTTDSSTQVISR